MLALAGFALPADAEGPTTTFKATYAISIGGVVVGKADAEGRFNGNSYDAAISGSTSGVTRLVSDAMAKLAGSGTFYGSRIMPSSYDLETTENGFATHVRMAMKSGNIVDVVAEPQLAEAPDRVPVTPAHKINVVDPLSAFLVPLDRFGLDRLGLPSGHRACTRTVRVFDGWTRYDVQLFYKDTRAVDGGTDMYSGRIIVCGARYIPIAGHRSGRKAVQDMADNQRLEVWLAPIKGMPVLVPYRILIGTDLGDLLIYATRFTTEPGDSHTDASKPATPQ